MADEIMEKAQKMGWVPQEEWKGDPDKWRPAEEFVERGENIIPILRDKVSKLEKDNAAIAALNQREIENIKRESYERAKREYDQKLLDLEAQEAQAFAEQDAAAFQEAKRKKKQLAPPAPPQPQRNVEFEQWCDKNPWYTEDDELREYADFVGGRIAAQYQARDGSLTIPLSELYEKVKERVKKMHPAKFENPNRNTPPAVEGNSPKPGGTKKKGWDTLPPSAKKQYERLAKNMAVKGRKLTKEQYAEYYFEQD